MNGIFMSNLNSLTLIVPDFADHKYLYFTLPFTCCILFNEDSTPFNEYNKLLNHPHLLIVSIFV